jgi:hypothetical protein
MPAPKGLKWTPAQVDAYKLLQTSKLTVRQIASQVGVSRTVVSRVNIAMKAGDVPPPEKLEGIFEDDIFGEPVQPSTGNEPPQSQQPAPQEKLEKYNPTMVSQLKGRAQHPGVASSFRFVNIPLACPITPIMLNARFVAENEWGWRKDMPWENFFDTILYLYCKAVGVTLQGYIIDEDIEEPEEEGAFPEEARGEGEVGGDGDKLDALAIKVMERIMLYSQMQPGQEGS